MCLGISGYLKKKTYCGCGPWLNCTWLRKGDRHNWLLGCVCSLIQGNGAHHKKGAKHIQLCSGHSCPQTFPLPGWRRPAGCFQQCLTVLTQGAQDLTVVQQPSRWICYGSISAHNVLTDCKVYFPSVTVPILFSYLLLFHGRKYSMLRLEECYFAPLRNQKLLLL